MENEPENNSGTAAIPPVAGIVGSKYQEQRRSHEHQGNHRTTASDECLCSARLPCGETFQETHRITFAKGDCARHSTYSRSRSQVSGRKNNSRFEVREFLCRRRCLGP